MKRFVRTFATLVIGMALGTATIAAAAPGTVEAVITKFKIVVNGQEAQLQNSPLVVNGTTYLPVREVASLLNADLKYNGTSKSIELSTKGDDVVTQTPANTLSFRDVVELLNKKYPDKNVGLNADGVLYVGDQQYKLPYKKSDDGTLYVAVQELIDLDLISSNDIQ